MNLRAIKTEAVDDSLDRQNLTLLRKRFLQINHDRLHRTRMMLTHQQEMFLDGLQLLFHCNHPMLPGFVSHSTPSGLSGYKPDKRQLAIGKSMAKSFCMTGGYQSESIWGIYLMGSLGSLAQSHKSDFDVWLCYKPGLSKASLDELQLKCKRITQWATTLRLETHFFLMDSDAFRNGEQLSLDEESSGSAQKLLLLDEFYRTALYIGGRLPIWWFSPAGCEIGYEAHTQELLQKRFLRPGTTLDFGGVNQIPDGEFIGAGIWQLYKAIESPYKSVIKLLLMEAYASEYPSIQPLSLEYKKAIYRGELHINDLDPYVLVYRRIERYLREEGDSVRLDLVRRCFYFKVNKPLSRPVSKRGKSWQRLLLEGMVSEWGWSEEYIHMLDQRPNWKTLQVKEERSLLVKALNDSYEVLESFAQRSGSARSISDSELRVLGRKLQAAFEKRPGKIECVNPGISSDISESVLTIVEKKSASRGVDLAPSTWLLLGAETGLDTPLRQAGSPVELLLWSHLNGLVDAHYRLDVSQVESCNEGQLKRGLSRLQQWLPMSVAPIEHEAFEQAAAPVQVFLLVNVGAEKISPLGGDIHRLSNQSDPLRYGGFEENLVASVDVITVNSWREVCCERYEGKLALIKALQAYTSLCLPGSHHAPPVLEIDCLGLSHASLLTHRVKQWFHEVCSCYYSGTKPPSTRYLFEMGGRYFSLQYSGARLIALEHKSLVQLLHYLGESQKRYSPIVVDSYALRGHALKLISKRIKPRSMYVFFKRSKGEVTVTVVDEFGSLIEFNMAFVSAVSLSYLHLFMRTTLEQIKAQREGADIAFDVLPICFHEITEDDLGRLSLNSKTVSPDIKKEVIFNITVNVSSTVWGRFEYDFDCGGRCFSWALLKQDVFGGVAEYALQKRGSEGRSPIFITCLNLERCEELLSSTKQLQVSHYLRIKVEIESKLNRAAGLLR